MPDYKNGKIYKITNDVNDKVYVGSTTQGLRERMIGHRSDRKRKSHLSLYVDMDNIGVEHFKMELIEEYPCECKRELLLREEYWIRKLNTNKCGYNIVVPFRTRGEHYKDNIIEINKRRREYRKRNIDKIRQWQKQNYQKYRENRLQYRKEYYVKNREVIMKKSKIWRAKNKDIIQQKSKRYHAKNRELLKKKSRDYYYKNKDKISKRNKEIRRIKREKQIE